MKKKIMTLVLTTAMTAAAGLTAFAGEWKSNDTGWWWLNDDGSNPAAEWKWLDGNKDGTFECYYFGNDGYMLSDTTTPDNYQVNKDGAWIVDGGVQLQFNLEENAGNDEEAGGSSGEASYEYDAYDLIGTYTSEDGDYVEMNLGVDNSLVGMFYDEDGSFDGIHSFTKVNYLEYKDSLHSKNIKFSNEGSFTMKDTVYYR